MKRRDVIRQAARELAAYIGRHPNESPLYWRILALTGGGDGYTDHELDLMERYVRRRLR